MTYRDVPEPSGVIPPASQAPLTLTPRHSPDDEQLEQITARIPGVILQFIMHPDGRMTLPYASRGILRLFRVTAEEVREDAFGVFAAVHSDDREEIVRSLYGSAQQRTPWHKKFRVLSNDGSFSWLFAKAIPETIKENHVILHGMVVDITELMREYGEPENARQLSGDETLQRYIAKIAHALQAPVSLLAGNVRRNVHPQFAENQGEQHKNIVLATDALVNMLDSLLVYSQLHSMTAKSPLVTVDIGVFCRDIVGEMTAACGETHRLHSAIPGDCGSTRLNDKVIHLILRQLIANAIKFTPAGGAISFEVRRESSQMVFMIEDSGIGIAEEDIPHIFDPLHCSRHGSGRQGLGLGLPIVRAALDKIGGTLTLDSAPEQGTSVSVLIPVFDEKEIQLENSQYSLLIIEDDRLLRNNMELILRMEGFDVRSAADAFAGLAQIHERCPDLILCDIMMPGMDGFAFFAQIKQKAELSDIIFIFVTALSDTPHVRQGMLAGADDYLGKPFSAEDLVATVATRLQKRTIQRNQGQLPDVSPEKRTLLQHISPREREVLLLVGQGKTSREIADTLFISQKTVEVHRGKLMKKLGATNAVMLAQWASIAEQLAR